MLPGQKEARILQALPRRLGEEHSMLVKTFKSLPRPEPLRPGTRSESVRDGGLTRLRLGVEPRGGGYGTTALVEELRVGAPPRRRSVGGHDEFRRRPSPSETRIGGLRQAVNLQQSRSMTSMARLAPIVTPSTTPPLDSESDRSHNSREELHYMFLAPVPAGFRPGSGSRPGSGQPRVLPPLATQTLDSGLGSRRPSNEQPGSLLGSRLPSKEVHFLEGCGGAVASSTLALEEVEELFERQASTSSASRKVAWSPDGPSAERPAWPTGCFGDVEARGAPSDLATDAAAVGCDAAVAARLPRQEAPIEGGRSFEDVRQRRRGNAVGVAVFERGELTKMREAFRRFKGADMSEEVSLEDLPALFSYLGYLGAIEDRVKGVANQVSEYSTFNFAEFVEVAELYSPQEPLTLLAAFNAAAGVAVSSAAPSPSSSSRSPAHGRARSPSKPSTAAGAGPAATRGRSRSPTKQPAAAGADAFAVAAASQAAAEILQSSGRVSRMGLMKLMRDLGSTARRAIVEEVLTECGLPLEQELSWEAFLHFVTAYQSREGFSLEQVATAQRLFLEVAGAKGLPATLLADSLVGFFGHHCVEEAQRLADRIVGSALDEASDGESGGGGAAAPSPAKGEGLSFHEFMVCARTLRETLLDEMWHEFSEADADGDGLVTGEELARLVQPLLGISLVHDSAIEFLADAGGSAEVSSDVPVGQRPLDFDGFLRLLDCCRLREGFTRAEAKELAAVFRSFDADGSEEIESIELLGMLRCLGYSTGLETVHELVKAVDVNNSGGLDLGEFLKLMRAHCEIEMQVGREVFNGRTGGSDELLAEHLPSALQDFGWSLDAAALSGVVREFGTPASLSFDDFFKVAQRCRRLFAEGRCRMAGFSVKEVDFFEGLFESSGTNKHKWIDWAGLERILGILGVLMSNLDKRKEVFETLEEARLKAREAGVDPAELGQPGDQAVLSLPLALHLIWALGHRRERMTIEREMKAMEATMYSHADVSGFREVFFNILERGTPLPREEGGVEESPKKQAVAPTMLRRASAPTLLESSAASAPPAAASSSSLAASAAKSAITRSMQSATRGEGLLNLRARLSGPLGGPTLSFIDVWELLRFLGLKPTPEHRLQLVSMIRKFTAGAGAWANENEEVAPEVVGTVDPVRDVVDFAAFLRLMHWMSEVNFARVNEAVASILSITQPHAALAGGGARGSLGGSSPSGAVSDASAVAAGSNLPARGGVAQRHSHAKRRASAC